MWFENDLPELQASLAKHKNKFVPEGIRDKDIKEFKRKIKRFEKDGTIIRYLDFGWDL
jgi:hypothetical protein